MISELGFAIAPNAFYPARTTGIGGFAVSLEASYTKINADKTTGETGGRDPYWHLGTQGAQDPNTKQFSTINNSPDSILQIYSIKARKGLPLGFELAGSLGTIANTGLWVGGGDVRWSLLEGFRTGALGLLPDFSIGGGVRTLTGTSKFSLTTAAFDVKMSKPIALADTSQLIPTVGYQRIVIFGDSNVIDSTPNVDALTQCGSGRPRPEHRRTALPQQARERRRQQRRLQQQLHVPEGSRASPPRHPRPQLPLRDHLARKPDRLRHHRSEGRKPGHRRGPPVDAVIRRRRLLLTRTWAALALGCACAAEACGAPSGGLVGASDRPAGGAIAKGSRDGGALDGAPALPADYRSNFTKVNKAKLVSSGHAAGRWDVDVYANEPALRALATRTREAPVGAMVVEEHFEKSGPGGTGPVMVMEKRAKGFSP